MKIIQSFSAFILIFTLSGCFYPQEQHTNDVAYKTQVQMVQSAVEQFKKDKGVLPIKTRDQDTPIYQKYPVDFKKLIPLYIAKPPGNSYQEGGIYQYVLVGVEKKPIVKLIDLRVVETVQKLQHRLDVYRMENSYPPFKEVLANKRYSLNYNKLGYNQPPYVKSPFTGKNLGFFIDNQSKVHVNYAKDLYEWLQKNGGQFKNGEDIRNLLVRNSFFVPVYSVPYTVKNDEPVFLLDH